MHRYRRVVSGWMHLESALNRQIVYGPDSETRVLADCSTTLLWKSGGDERLELADFLTFRLVNVNKLRQAVAAAVKCNARATTVSPTAAPTAMRKPRCTLVLRA